jgi:hypothetical protein
MTVKKSRLALRRECTVLRRQCEKVGSIAVGKYSKLNGRYETLVKPKLALTDILLQRF